jgi:RHH-type proline utilization regulon transcriptional repressor/proline dehydrogenase/delta 1-pyrroline-5-carboxylate dehydrogenase
MIIDQATLEKSVNELAREIFKEVSASTLSVFDAEFYTGKLMDWSMKDEEFKINLFRFVDVFPTLSSSSAVVRHAQEYFDGVAERIPGIVRWGLKVNPNGISAMMGAKVISQQMKQMAGKFIVGESGKAALKSLKDIRKHKFAFTVDLLGEAAVNEEEALEYQARYFEVIDTLGVEVPKWREARAIVEGHHGEETPVHVSVKLSSLYSQIKAVASNKAIEVLTERFGAILERAMANNCAVTMDMEDSSMTSISLELFKHVLSDEKFKNFNQCGIVLQSYMRRSEADLDDLLRWARTRGGRIPIRLVKGAYWDTEKLSSRLNSWPCPVWEVKESTDACYERMTRKLFASNEFIFPAFGTHNIRSAAYAIKVAEHLEIPKTNFELQVLHGMNEPLKKAISDRGFLVREYAPVGELLPGMSYLVRRLLENTSNEGFLRQGFYEHSDVEKLIKAPAIVEADQGTSHLNFNPRKKFKNIPNTDFSLEGSRVKIANEIESIIQRAKVKPPVVKPFIRGEYVDGQEVLFHSSPEDKELKVCEIHLASEGQAVLAIDGLRDYFLEWKRTSVEVRADVLFKAAELMEKRRAELSAIITVETSKPWVEADADVSEAIDFCNYYAIEALRIAKPQKLGDYPGENNQLMYEPRGVCAVIAPWNFPLAIPCGMFAASLVMGNTTLLKPAEQSSRIANELFDTFIAAGLPTKAAAFLPALGEKVGPEIMKHASVSTVCFTGSKAVGLQLLKQAAEYSVGKSGVKRVIAEMGGKNAIIVDDDADTDEAVKGVLQSAFGFAGQKCSACSRVIVVGDLYPKFVARLKSAVNDLIVGPAYDPATFVNAVIDEIAYLRLRSFIEEAKKRAVVLAETKELSKNAQASGNFIKPIVFAEIATNDPILSEELFGPVLAVIKANSFIDAVRIATESEYALTGAVFSRSPKNIEYALAEFRVGNLYINRGSTGALVMRQPFGGFGMSGVGSKAGGPDYLYQFTVPRAISENTIRRGFAPQ